mgnify:CR=1 FL=1|jgi:hypothetical protein
MDFFGFAKPGTEFAKPVLDDFADEDGYVDYYEFDMAMDQWQSQFPNLNEFWCGEPAEKEEVEVDDSLESLYTLLAA